MNEQQERVVAVSGGFDPVHVGHLELFKEARKLGTKLVVIVNNDNWLRAKKGFAVMPEVERVAVLQELPYVDEVILTSHEQRPEDMSVCDALVQVRPHVFANGGDRFADNVPEVGICKELGIELVFNIGGGKVQSSSDLVKEAHAARITTHRPWGSFKNHEAVNSAMLKTLHILPGKRLSLQRHAHRDELWVLIEGDATATLGTDVSALERVPLQLHVPILVPRGTLHRLESKEGCTIVEVSGGHFDEEDIERIEDDFGRAER